MHATRSPSSISATPPGDVLDLSLSGSRLSFSKRPGGGAGMLPAGKFLARSVSVSAPCEARGKRNTLGSPRSVKNLRRSNSTTHVSQQAHFALSNKGAVGNAVTTILHNNHGDKPLTPKSSNQRPPFNLLKASANDDVSLENSSLTKSQKNFSSTSSNNKSPVPRASPPPQRCNQVSEEEAEYIQQVNQAAVTIQRWFRRHARRRRANRVALRRILDSKRKEWQERAEAESHLEMPRDDRKLIREEKARQARLAAIQELQQKRAQHHPPQAPQLQGPEADVENRRASGMAPGKKPAKILPSSASPTNTASVSPTHAKANNTFHANVAADLSEVSFRVVSPALTNHRASPCAQEHPRRRLSGEDRSCAASKSTLNDLLDTIKLLEEEPEHFSEPKCYNKDKYAWLDPDGDADSLTADNLERHIQLSLPPPLPPDGDGAALLSEAKLQSIMNFLDEMEKSEQERPRSTASHREAAFLEEEVAPALDPASATAAQVSGSIMRIKMELEEKKRLVEMLQNALAQQRELTVQHVKETEKELSRNLQLQRDQYEATVQRHLTFIDQLIGDKKALSERCEGAIAELKLVDHKYTKKISQMQEQHEMVWQILGPLCEEIKKLKELMSVTEKIRREKWIDEKTKKIKEITVKGLEPDIQKLISKHKQELKKLRTLHEAELLHAHEQGAERCARQCEELRRQLENEKEEQCRRERDLKFEKQLQEEELSLQQHRKRIHKEVADEKERLAQLAAQHSEMEELRRRMEENSCMAGRVFREELDKTREEQERRHQAELTKLQERFDQEKMSWEEEYRKKQEAGLLRHERQLREELRQERDKEIQLAIWTLEEETSKDKEESERAAQNRVNRVREAYEVELKELERSLRESLDKQQELRKHHNRDQLLEERHGLASVIQQEFDARLLLAEEEAQRARVEAEEVRVTLQAEVDRISKEKEDELHEVHQVKAAILKKDEAVNALRRQHEAALKRAEHLEALWEEQRRQLMEK
uniref:Centrosomal protein 131 n=1 Tax=Hippocampus comes TaxID=109280 RepID=A0A3Q2YDB0_HIPCM